MPSYQITAPDGSVFEVTSPEGATEQEVLSYAQSEITRNTPQNTAEAVRRRAEAYNFPTSAADILTRMQPEVKGRLQASAMGAGQGVTANFLDELIGQAGGDTEAYRKLLAQSEKQYPTSYTVGQIGGAGLGSAAALMAAPSIPAAIAASPTMLGRAGLTGLASIPGGVLQGMGVAEGTATQRVPSGIIGGITSGLTGAALSPLVEMGAKIVKPSIQSENIPLTLGQQLQNAQQQAFESSALKGAKGVPAQEIMSSARDIQQQAISNRMNRLKANTGIEAADQYAAIGDMTTALKIQNDATKKQVNNAYKFAKQSGKAEIAATDVKSLLQDEINTTQKDFNLSTLPKGQALLSDLNKLTTKDITKQSSLLDMNGDPIKPLKELAPVDVVEMERWRRKVSRATQSNDLEEAAFAREMLKKYDDFHNTVIDNALIKGDEKTVSAYKSARDLRAEQGRRFESNEIVKNILSKDNTPETVMAKIYGAGSFNGNKEAANTAKAILKAAGDNALQAQNQLKFAALDRMMTRAESKEIDEFGRPILSPAKLQTEINNLLNNNRSLANIILTNEDKNLLIDTKKQLDKIVSSKPGAINTSNSAEKIMANISRFSGVPIVGDIARSFRNAGDARKAMVAIGQLRNDLLKPNVEQTKFILSGTRAISPETGLNKRKR